MASESNAPPRAVLYCFGGSVWSAPAVLTAHEKRYLSGDLLDIRDVNLVKGENFSPGYLALNPFGTVPTLVVPIKPSNGDASARYQAFTDSISICAFLDSATTSFGTASGGGGTMAGAPVARSLTPATIDQNASHEALIKRVHDQSAPDPNALLLSARDDAERDAKASGLPGDFVRGRQAALEQYSKEAPPGDDRLMRFYAEKREANGQLCAIFATNESERATPAALSAWYKQSEAMWANVAKTLALFEEALTRASPEPPNGHGRPITAEGTGEEQDEPGSFLLAHDEISLADLHAGAWLARILACAGATSILQPAESAKALVEGSRGKAQMGERTLHWWAKLSKRESFKQTYKDGLH